MVIYATNLAVFNCPKRILNIMNQSIESTIFKSGIGLLLFSVIFLFSQCNQGDEEKMQLKTGMVRGEVNSYADAPVSGKLYYWDAISKNETAEFFIIDNTGTFEIPVKLFHPIYHSAILDIGRESYYLFLEPGKDLQIKITDRSIEFQGESGVANTQIRMLEDTIYHILEEEIKHCDTIRYTRKPLKYIWEQFHDLSNKKINIIKAMDDKYDFEPAVINALEMDAYYGSAKFWVKYNKESFSGGPRKSDSLTEKFFENLLTAYPVNKPNAFVSRNYGDYISSIVKALREDGHNGNLIEFIESQGEFSQEEKTFVVAYYNRDTSITNTESFKHFFNYENRVKLWDLRNSYVFYKLLDACRNFPRGAGRDIIISQAFCDWYYGAVYRGPSDEEWENVFGLLESEDIYYYLKELDSTYSVATSSQDENETRMHPSSGIEDILNKYNDQVIYIDIYATWCVPCRMHMPYSKSVIEKFKDEKVAFLFLCCQSPEKDWESMIRKEEMPGHHYYISREDYPALDEMFNIKGFPTYVLINKEGKVITTNATHPNYEQALADQLNELL